MCQTTQFFSEGGKKKEILSLNLSSRKVVKGHREYIVIDSGVKLMSFVWTCVTVSYLLAGGREGWMEGVFQSFYSALR